ncbi:MAG: hypothetical protein KGL74_11345, partial [Elusimicrobia bacterium]|nr:hypothetical protein [Elusimicrobiota bacterium]
MAEGQKIQGMPVTYGGMRYGTYFHLFRDDRFLNLTLYGEYEDLNEAALYKMEVAGFGPEDLTGPLAPARHAPVRTFEQRVIAYHDWDRVNATFNFIRETSLQSPRGSDYGYALGLFFKPSETTGTMAGMADMAAPPALSMSRFGCGLELIGALGDNRRFGFYWNAQQHYLGPVLTYALSPRWSAHLEPAFGLSDVSDPFVLRTGVTYMFGPRDPGAAGGGAVHAELRVDQRRVLRHHLRPGGRHAFQGFDSDRQRLPPPPRVFSRGHPGRPALGPRREEGLGTSAFAQRRLHGRARGG